MIAVGKYLYTLREEQGYTQEHVIDLLWQHIGRKIDKTTLWRIENGKRKAARSDILTGLIDVLGGNGDDMMRLANDKEASDLDGYNAAIRWLRRDQVERIDAAAAEPGDDLDVVIEELRAEYRRSPGLVTHLRTFLAGWRGRGDAPPQR